MEVYINVYQYLEKYTLFFCIINFKLPIFIYILITQFIKICFILTYAILFKYNSLYPQSKKNLWISQMLKSTGGSTNSLIGALASVNGQPNSSSANSRQISDHGLYEMLHEYMIENDTLRCVGLYI